MLKKHFSAIYLICALVLALLITGIFILLSGQNPITAYFQIVHTAFFTTYGLSETLVKMIPLAIVAVGISIALKAGLWNIGGEGQFYIGALFATYFILFFHTKYHTLNILFALMLGFIGGAFWSAIPALLRVKLRINEILTTLLLNYVAIYIVDYFVYGPWKGSDNFPFTEVFSANTLLPSLHFGRLHLGLILAVLLVFTIFIVYNYTKTGYELDILGDNTKTAEYGGINVKTYLFWTLTIGGAIAGLAGAVQIMGIEFRLHHQISADYGFTAIVVVWLARNKPIQILIVAFLLAGLITGVEALQIFGLPQAVGHILRGFILMLVLGETYFKRRYNL